MSRIQLGFIIGTVIAVTGLFLRLAAHALATRWESLGPSAWAGTTDPAIERTCQAFGLTIFAFGLVLLSLAFYRWLFADHTSSLFEMRD